MPNPSNSDLVGEDVQDLAERALEHYKFASDATAHLIRTLAREVGELAQQLEQAEQRAVLAERQLKAVDKALPPWETERTEAAQAVGVVGRVQTIFNLIADRAALTTPDSSTGQEEGTL